MHRNEKLRGRPASIWPRYIHHHDLGAAHLVGAAEHHEDFNHERLWLPVASSPAHFLFHYGAGSTPNTSAMPWLWDTWHGELGGFMLLCEKGKWRSGYDKRAENNGSWGAKTGPRMQPMWLLFSSPTCGFTRCVPHAVQSLGPMAERQLCTAQSSSIPPEPQLVRNSNLLPVGLASRPPAPLKTR